jgi:hypothetical protein
MGEILARYEHVGIVLRDPKDEELMVYSMEVPTNTKVLQISREKEGIWMTMTTMMNRACLMIMDL